MALGPLLIRLRALVVKELLAVWRDRRSRFVLIVPPLVQVFVLSHAATYDVTHVSLAVLDHDRSTASRGLVARFAQSPTFARVFEVRDEAALARAIDSREAMVALAIGQGFSRHLAAATPAPVQLVFDGRSSNTAQILQAYALGIVADAAAAIAAERGLPAVPGRLEMRAWFNPNLESMLVVVPGILGILSMLEALVVTALSVARERESGTFDQLLVTPLGSAEILLGKTAPALIVGLGAGTVVLLVAVFLFGVPFVGSLALLYASLALFLLAVIGVGLFISSICSTQQQAILGAFLFMVPAVILSGFATPLENMPEWMAPVTAVNPLRWFIGIVQGVFLKDLGPALVFEEAWPLAVIAAVALSTAAWMFRARLE